MKNLKIAIIGAGIVGLYLAWKLSKKGHKVFVFEKKEKIGKKACSGLVSKRILDFIPQSQKLVENQISSALIHFPKKTLRIKFSKKFFALSHFKLDNLVAEFAEKSGAQINLKNSVDSLPTGFDRIIGCDGVNSTVRKKINLPEPEYRLGILGFLEQNDSKDYVETWPVERGFIWKIPRGSKTEYGIISSTKEAKEIFYDFLKRKNLKLRKIESALIPQGFSTSAEKSITLCGDATGLTKNWSGGGIIWGLISADILLKNFPDFLKYQKALKRFFLPKTVISKFATKIAYFIGYNLPWLIPEKIKIESDFLV